MRYAAYEPSPQPHLELTPLIDVIFVILVCFMLVAPLIEVDEVELASGHVLEQRTLDNVTRVLTVHVKQDDSVWIDGESISDGQLPKILVSRRLKQGSRVTVIHDRRARFGTYEWLKGQLRQAGFEQMDLVLKPSRST